MEEKFSRKKVKNYADNQAQFKKFFIAMLEQGIYLAPLQFETETLFVSAAHSDADFEKTVNAAKFAFKELF